MIGKQVHEKKHDKHRQQSNVKNSGENAEAKVSEHKSFGKTTEKRRKTLEKANAKLEKKKLKEFEKQNKQNRLEKKKLDKINEKLEVKRFKEFEKENKQQQKQTQKLEVKKRKELEKQNKIDNKNTEKLEAKKRKELEKQNKIDNKNTEKLEKKKLKDFIKESKKNKKEAKKLEKLERKKIEKFVRENRKSNSKVKPRKKQMKYAKNKESKSIFDNKDTKVVRNKKSVETRKAVKETKLAKHKKLIKDDNLNDSKSIDRVLDRAESKKEKKTSLKDELPFNLAREIFEWVYPIVIVFSVVFLLRLYIFDIVKVDGSSMSPTLHDNDRLVVTKMQYTPNKGDIIIFDSNYKRREEYISEYEDVVGRRLNIIERAQFKVNRQKRFKTEYYVKRIIALPEQIVDVRDGDVYVDDVLLDEDYNSQKTYTVDDGIEFPVKIDENYVFVLGDNRGASNDSRSSEIALIPYEAILGKSQARIFPLTNIELTK